MYPDASITYSPDDIQLGDLDGDGELEIVVKREPYDGANMGVWFNEYLLCWKHIKWTGLSCGGLIWELTSVPDHIILLISCMILMVTVCVKLLSVLPKVQSLPMARLSLTNGKVNDYRNRQTDGKG